MAERVDKLELVGRVARRLDRDGETVAEIVDGFLEEIYAALKGGEGVSLRGLAPSTSGRSGTAGCSSSTRRSACARCLVGRRPTAGRCEPTMTGLERRTVQWVQSHVAVGGRNPQLQLRR
jgi:Bacterial DNA-binding protein